VALALAVTTPQWAGNPDMHESLARDLQASSEMLGSEYLRMARVEADMWWYTSLHADLLDLVRGHFGAGRSMRILDAGCGTGGFLRYLRSHGYANCTGLDISPIAVDFCRQQGLEVLQGSIADQTALARAGSADLIVAMDVICSLPDQQQRVAFFQAASSQLNDGGMLIVQTPAFRCLGGIHDLAVGVNQRYTKAEMQALLRLAGIDGYRLRYRMLLLAPLVLLARSLQRLRLRVGSKVTIESDVKLPPAAVNTLLFHLQRFEDRWLACRPFGTSLQILIKKVRET
jgi:SAM-dependent methyltransferase